MSLYPCSGCGQRLPGKLSQVYWAWTGPEGKRIAGKQRLCLGCFVERVITLAQTATESIVNCPGCGIDTVEDMDPVYATVFLPGVAKQVAEMACCPACAITIRNMAQQGWEPLEDRVGDSGGLNTSPPTMPPVSGWDSLGLRPLRGD